MPPDEPTLWEPDEITDWKEYAEGIFSAIQALFENHGRIAPRTWGQLHAQIFSMFSTIEHLQTANANQQAFIEDTATALGYNRDYPFDGLPSHARALAKRAVASPTDLLDKMKKAELLVSTALALLEMDLRGD